MRKIYTSIVYGLLLSLNTSAQTPLRSEVELSKNNYNHARIEIENMLSGKTPASYERAMYLVENAWWDNTVNYSDFTSLITYGVNSIKTIQAQSFCENSNTESKDFFEALRQKNQNEKGFAETAKANYAIYKYMTDTTVYIDNKKGYGRYHLPYQYATFDPMGTIDLTNTQVGNLLLNGRGNCYAFVSLYKIYAERLNTDAKICIAPGHVYIRHHDQNGTLFNVELSGRAFPGTGTLSTLTYSTKESIQSGISLRELDLRQSIALSLIYLAKGYEYKFIDYSDFSIACADAALKYDSLNLNAMLLKTEIFERKLLSKSNNLSIIKGNTGFYDCEQLVSKLYGLGYREMPLEMKNLLIKGWSRDKMNSLSHKSNKPKQFQSTNSTPIRYASLSWGLFDEQIANKPVERYGRFLFDTKNKRIVGIAKEEKLYNNYNFDPVVFALSVDPLAEKFYDMSPYVAMGNNPIRYIDPDGKAFIIGDGGNVDKNGRAFFAILNARAGGIFEMDKKGNVTIAAGKSLNDVTNSETVSKTLAGAIVKGIGDEKTQTVYFRAEGKNDKVFLDNITSGQVDVGDLKNMDLGVQAVTMTHFITERYSIDDYEGMKGNLMNGYTAMTKEEKMQTLFWKGHTAGIGAERDALGDVTGISMGSGDRQEDSPPEWTIWDYGKGIRIDFTRGYDNETFKNTSVNSGTIIRP